MHLIKRKALYYVRNTVEHCKPKEIIHLCIDSTLLVKFNNKQIKFPKLKETTYGILL